MSAEIVVQPSAKSEGTEHPLLHPTPAPSKASPAKQVACRTSDIHTRTLRLLQAAQIDLRSAIEVRNIASR